MTRIALSLDFDFFARPSAQALDGVQETPYYQLPYWYGQYMMADLYSESAPETHADFMPLDLWAELKARGLVPRADLRCGVAESHDRAIEWFRRSRSSFDRIVHIDAHHDCGDFSGRVHCGNWLTAFSAETPATLIYPRWKDPQLDRPVRRKNARVVKWRDFRGFGAPAEISAMFVCRSAPWVPPHFDALFLRLIRRLRLKARVTIIEDILIRSEAAPSRRAAKAYFEETRSALGNLRVLSRDRR